MQLLSMVSVLEGKNQVDLCLVKLYAANATSSLYTISVEKTRFSQGKSSTEQLPLDLVFSLQN